MNQFTYLRNISNPVILQLRGWLQKIEEYVGRFHEGDYQCLRGTKFGDCIAKARYIEQRAIGEPLLFRGVCDMNGRLQAAAIVEQDTGSIYMYDEGHEYLYLDALTNAPWNIIGDQPEAIKGAATSLMEAIVRESILLGYNGIVKIQSIKRAKPFYEEIGFVENPDGSGEMVLTEENAGRFLQIQQSRQLRLD